MKIWRGIVSHGNKYNKMSEEVRVQTASSKRVCKISRQLWVKLNLTLHRSEFRGDKDIFVLHFWTWNVIFWNLATIVVYDSAWTFLGERNNSLKGNFFHIWLGCRQFFKVGKWVRFLNSNVKLKYQDPSFLIHIYGIVKYLMTKIFFSKFLVRIKVDS